MQARPTASVGRAAARCRAFALVACTAVFPACVSRVAPEATFAPSKPTPPRAVAIDSVGHGSQNRAAHPGADRSSDTGTPTEDSVGVGALQEPDGTVTDGAIWPDTWRQSGNGPRGVVIELDTHRLDHGARWLGEHHQLITADVEREDASRLAAAVGAPGGFSFKPEGPGSFVFIELDPERRPTPSASDPTRSFRHVQGRLADTRGGVERVEIERTWFSWSEPAAGQEPRGTVVLLPGLFGTPEAIIDRVERTLRVNGWSVLRAWSLPARFTQRLRVEVLPGAEEVAAQTLAEELGRRAAATAYAVDATASRLLELEPAYAGKPVVLLGMSGGAISLSTVHARNPDLYDGAVLIAGGVNFLGINLFSDYAPWVESLTIDWTPGDGDEGTTGAPPTEQAGEHLASLYLERAPLDGFHLASKLRGKPTLIIHGSADDAVPAVFGDELWERAGKPERWVLPLGHEALFVLLPMQANRVARWLAESFPVEAAADAVEDGG